MSKTTFQTYVMWFSENKMCPQGILPETRPAKSLLGSPYYRRQRQFGETKPGVIMQADRQTLA